MNASKRLVSGRGIALAIILGTALALSACAHRKMEKKIDEKTATTAPLTQAELEQESVRAIETAPQLSDIQRAQLLELRANVRRDLSALREEEASLRALLLRETLDPASEPGEFRAIRRRMKKVDDRTRDVIFAAVDRANHLLGRHQLRTEFLTEVLGDKGRP